MRERENVSERVKEREGGGREEGRGGRGQTSVYFCVLCMFSQCVRVCVYFCTFPMHPFMTDLMCTHIDTFHHLHVAVNDVHIKS